MEPLIEETVWRGSKDWMEQFSSGHGVIIEGRTNPGRVYWDVVSWQEHLRLVYRQGQRWSAIVLQSSHAMFDEYLPPNWTIA